jgi:signal transduction histidine kinase
MQQSRERHSWNRLREVRPFFVVPGMLALAVFSFADPASWRGPLMVGGGAGVLAFLLFDHRRARRRPEKVRFAGSALAPIVFQFVPVLVTGGLDSPFLGLSVGMAAYVGGQAAPGFLIVLQSALLAGVAVLHIAGWPPQIMPRIFGGAEHAHTPTLLLTTVLVQVVVYWIAYEIGRSLRHGYDVAMADSVRAREEVVRQGNAHATELQSVCGEISHELKNPLATIRGLVELMTLDAPGPRNAERLAVVLREALRMQASLEELLNLARPLSPLDLAPVDLEELRAEVCSLHEGMGAAAGVTIAAPALGGGQRTVRGDFRKLRQVLVNLVQNAIEASARGATVTVAVRERADGADIEVEDEGKGIEPTVSERAFEPGVTTKARGNGLGLTIARSIARQHGGDVVLRSRTPRGCVAVLVLPRECPDATAAAAT